jgi:hypothetical protein
MRLSEIPKCSAKFWRIFGVGEVCVLGVVWEIPKW